MTRIIRILKEFNRKWIVGECRHLCLFCKYKEHCFPSANMVLDIIYEQDNTLHNRRAIYCWCFELLNNKELLVYGTRDDWYRQAPSAIYSNVTAITSFPVH